MLREILAIEVTAAVRRGAPCAPVCAPPGGVCPRECRGAFLKTVAAGLTLAAALTLAGPDLALANLETVAEARGPLGQLEGTAAEPQDSQAQDAGAAAADQHPQGPDADAADAQELHPRPLGAAEDANDAPPQPAHQTATAPWPPWQTWR